MKFEIYLHLVAPLRFTKTIFRYVAPGKLNLLSQQNTEVFD